MSTVEKLVTRAYKTVFEMSENIISLTNVRLEKFDKIILDDINITLNKGDCCTIIGPNGAGKSSLLSILSGYDWPSVGTVCFCGEKYGEVDLFKIRQKIGIVSTSRMPEFAKHFSVSDIIETGFFGTHMIPFGQKVSENQSKIVNSLLKEYKLEGFANRLFTSLSTGEKMKTLILRAIVSNPKLLLLDEPVSGLDIYNRALVLEFIETISKTDIAILIISHHLEEMPQCTTNATLLKNGKILASGMPETVLTGKNLSALFDCNVKVVSIEEKFYSHAML